LTIAATRLIAAGEPTEDPPNFMSITESSFPAISLGRPDRGNSKIGQNELRMSK
jgi:hypothetical protein